MSATPPCTTARRLGRGSADGGSQQSQEQIGRVLLAPGVNPTYEKVATAIAGSQNIRFERLAMDSVTAIP